VAFWFVGFVAGDIVLKGVLESVNNEDVSPVEGGILQHFRDEKERMSPDKIAGGEGKAA